MISVVNVFDSLAAINRKLRADNTEKVREANAANAQVYEAAYLANPDNFRIEKTFRVTANNPRYALPSDFMNINAGECGLFDTDISTFYLYLELSAISGALTLHETLTGGASGATGKIQEIGTTYVVLYVVSGTFTAAETVTGSSSGETATVGDNDGFVPRQEPYTIEKKGSFNEGYDFDGNYIFKSPLSTSTATGINQLRYIPIIDLFVVSNPVTDDIVGNFIDIPYSEGDYLEMLQKLVKIQYEWFDRKDYKWETAQIAAKQVTDDFFGKISKKPKIFSI